MGAGIYIHIPFCRSKCPYCDFYSVTNKASVKGYISALHREIEKRGREYEKPVDTLYFGGGTPSSVSAEELCEIIEKVKESFNCDLQEITVECNPSDVSDEYIAMLAGAGVNRISMGVQSAVDCERKILGRRADKKQVKSAVASVINAGIANVSLDLMIGVPQQSSESLHESLDFCISSGATHISAYILSLEEGTCFYKNADKLGLPDEDETAKMYLLMCEQLQKNGFYQYEISNFAKPGFESRHNSKYWLLEDYIGIGAAAHSFIGGERFYYPRDIEYFIAGGEPIADGCGGDDEEKIMLSLRMSKGVDVSLIDNLKAEKYEAAGLGKIKNGRFSLTPRGFLLSNSIIADLLP